MPDISGMTRNGGSASYAVGRAELMRDRISHHKWWATCQDLATQIAFMADRDAGHAQQCRNPEVWTYIDFLFIAKPLTIVFDDEKKKRIDEVLTSATQLIRPSAPALFIASSMAAI